MFLERQQVPAVAGDQVISRDFCCTLQNAVVCFVGLDHIGEPAGLNDNGSFFQRATSLGYTLFVDLPPSIVLT